MLNSTRLSDMVPVKSFGRGVSLRPQRLVLPCLLKSLIPVLSRLPPGSHIYKPSLRLSKWYWSLSGPSSLRITQHSCQKNQEVSPSHGGTVAHTTTKQGFLSLLSPRVLRFLPMRLKSWHKSLGPAWGAGIT